MEATSLRFATAARTLGRITRRRGLLVPGFRSPPRVADADRTVRRRGDGATMVAVRLRGRPWTAVVSDMVEGIVVANRLFGAEADATRRALWAGIESDGLLPAEPATSATAAPSRADRHLALAPHPEAA
jgi:hypothetical protein